MKVNEQTKFAERKNEFLETIRKRLSRDHELKRNESLTRKNIPLPRISKNLSEEKLIHILKEQCKNIHVNFMKTTKDNISETLQELFAHYDGKSIIISNDERLKELGVNYVCKQLALQDEIEYFMWDESKSKESIQFAERADIGITCSDITLAESATVTLLSRSGTGRSISLLPKININIVPRSTICYRLTDAMPKIRKQSKQIGKFPSCIQFISGPSNSADIEMNLVIGVHGPLHVAYVVVEDM